jgi:peroxiredoxin
VSISEQILPSNAIQVGETIPSFSAPDDRGELFNSARLRGNPVLIKFFRAHW